MYTFVAGIFLSPAHLAAPVRVRCSAGYSLNVLMGEQGDILLVLSGSLCTVDDVKSECWIVWPRIV